MCEVERTPTLVSAGDWWTKNRSVGDVRCMDHKAIVGDARRQDRWRFMIFGTGGKE